MRRTASAVDERVLGILLLCLGVGSLLAMFFAGTLSSRFGTRPVILVSGFGLAAVLPWLAIASTPFTLGVTLLFFGATLGSLDVAMNIHGVEVERARASRCCPAFTRSTASADSRARHSSRCCCRWASGLCYA